MELLSQPNTDRLLPRSTYAQMLDLRLSGRVCDGYRTRILGATDV
jgi:hypothetical protein